MANGKAPTLSKILKKLELVLEGDLTREEVSDWAGKYVLDEELRIEDEKVSSLLDIVFGIDTKVSPHEYLHTDIQIMEWIVKYSSKEFFLSNFIPR